MTADTVVIGAGVVGISAALALLQDGHRVTIVADEEPGSAASASFGNGAWISPASVVPVAMPGLWRKVPGYLLDPSGPFVIRPAALLPLLPWLARFVLAGATVARVERTARALRPLLADAPERHAALAAAAGVPDLIRRDGLLYAYPDRSAFEAEELAWRVRRDNGLDWRELEGDSLRQLEPALSADYGFGAYVEAGAHCRDPGRYVAALASAASSRGARSVRARATGFSLEAKRLRAVRTTAGEIVCGQAVVAAGIGSKALARAAGDRVRLESERGYHVVLTDPETAPAIPVMPSDGKMANTPTLTGLRAAGQVELAAAGTPPDWRRADILLEHLRRAFPGFPAELSSARISRWMGHRPSTPDGLPVIGPASASPDIVYAFGHGHVGLAAAPATGDAVASLLAGRQSPFDLAPYTASRRLIR